MTIVGSAEGPVAAGMRARLTEAFAPERLEIVDDSARHAGHAGAGEGGESHFNVEIVSSVFQGLSRVERQRRVNAVLKEALAGPVHALSIRARTPDEG